MSFVSVANMVLLAVLVSNLVTPIPTYAYIWLGVAVIIDVVFKRK